MSSDPIVRGRAGSRRLGTVFLLVFAGACVGLGPTTPEAPGDAADTWTLETGASALAPPLPSAAGSEIRMHACSFGFASPLILVDGRRVSDDALDVRPEEIERIRVVKGPEALARYGPDAAKGVILISTRSGVGAEGADGAPGG